MSDESKTLNDAAGLIDIHAHTLETIATHFDHKKSTPAVIGVHAQLAKCVLSVAHLLPEWLMLADLQKRLAEMPYLERDSMADDDWADTYFLIYVNLGSGKFPPNWKRTKVHAVRKMTLADGSSVKKGEHFWNKRTAIQPDTREEWQSEILRHAAFATWLAQQMRSRNETEKKPPRQHAETLNFVPDADDLKILGALASTTYAQDQYAIEGATNISRRTLTGRLKKLRDAGLTSRPNGQRNGETITEAGRALIAH